MASAQDIQAVPPQGSLGLSPRPLRTCHTEEVPQHSGWLWVREPARHSERTRSLCATRKHALMGLSGAMWNVIWSQKPPEEETFELLQFLVYCTSCVSSPCPPPSLPFLILPLFLWSFSTFLYLCVSVCAYAHACHSACVEVTGQLKGIGSATFLGV